MKLVWDILPEKGNSRNSEGSFIRLHDGKIMYAYSRFSSDDADDNAGCDIAAIFSSDEGESWTEPEIIIRANSFDTKNIMCASAIYQNNGEIGIYFLIKEPDGNISIGRGITTDGKAFRTERCVCNFIRGYHVINNDRFIRLSDGRIAAVSCVVRYENKGYGIYDDLNICQCLVSEDDGKTFTDTPPRLTVPYTGAYEGPDQCDGMQEPGIAEFLDGTIWLWARTRKGMQYECFSRDKMQSFTYPQPSRFTSPCSPMEVARNPENNDLYVVYNPAPNYNGRDTLDTIRGRTPIVIRKSTDDGRSWGEANVIENDEKRGYCYPAMFFTKDNSLLVAYCRGAFETGFCLNELGIMKIDLAEIE